MKNGFFELFVKSDYESIQYESEISTSCKIIKDINDNFIIDDIHDNDDVTIETIPFIQNLCPLANNHSLKIKGKVTFFDGNEPKMFYATGNSLVNHPRRKSPLTTAWLFFRTSEYPNQLTHPIPLNQTTGLPIEGIHYVKCVEGTNFNEESGEFTFEFNYDPLSLYCQTNENMTIEVYIAKENEATILNSGSNNIIVTNIPNPFYTANTTLKLFPSKYFSCTYTNDVPPIIDISYNIIHDLNIELPGDEGAIFRYTTLSREFIKDAYNNPSLEFPSHPLISNERKVTQCISVLEWKEYEENDHPGGEDGPGTRAINIYKYYGDEQTNYANCKVISHEYGHFFDWWLTHYFHGEKEAFALFFSYATNVWMHNSFGDLFSIDDDCEIGPFAKYTIGGNIKIINEGEDNEVEYNRFGNISKMGVPDINSCRFACYLWNIYDSKSEQPFSPIVDWDGMSNDDVEDLRTDLLNYWINCPFEVVHFYKDFHDYFKAEYISNTALQNSLQSIYNFMDFPKEEETQFLNLPIEEIEERMKCPDLFFENTITPDLNGYQVQFIWNNVYSNIPFEYVFTINNPVEKVIYQFSNKDSEVKIEKQIVNNGSWIFLDEINDCVENTQTDWYEIPHNVIYLKYKLSEINPVTSSVIHENIFDFGIPDDKINLINDENIKNNFDLRINNNILSIQSINPCFIQSIKIYDVLGILIDEIKTKDMFSNYHEIELNRNICYRNMISIIQINYLDSFHKQNVSYLKLINY